MTDGTSPLISRSNLLAIFAIGFCLFLVWQFSSLLLLLFAAVVVAVPLRAGAAFLERHAPISARLGLLLVVAVVTTSLG